MLMQRELGQRLVGWLEDRQERRSEIRQKLRSIWRANAGGLLLARVLEVSGIATDGMDWIDVIKAVIEWLSDPENQEKIMAIIEFVISILMMFGIAI